jgi:hypothetical protein
VFGLADDGGPQRDLIQQRRDNSAVGDARATLQVSG